MKKSTQLKSSKPLSKIRCSKMGYEFDVYGDHWRLDGSQIVNWTLLIDLGVDDDFLSGFRKILADFACEMSARYTGNISKAVNTLVRTTGDKKLSVVMLQNYLSTLDKNNEYKLGGIRGCLLEWFERGYEGISKDVVTFLEQLVLRGNVEGAAVAKSCPHSGAFSLNEQQAILEWAVNAFVNNDISLIDYTWLMLLLYTGQRAVQLRSLTWGDLTVSQLTSGEVDYHLQIPKAKQRGKRFREIFKKHDIDEDLTLLLTNQAKLSIQTVEAAVGEKLSDDMASTVPVFLHDKRVKKLKNLREYIDGSQSKPDYFFMTSSVAGALLGAISHKCQARSDRLNGEFIHLTSRRFRYTLGTNAFRRGMGVNTIAELLGHSTNQHASVYTENTYEVVDQIDEAMAPVLAPLAQAFAGVLIESEKEAIRANDPRSRIKINDGSSVGSCGEFGFCASGGRQCYLCTKFQPWVHAPHEKMLQSVINERETLRKCGASDFVVQSTDRVLLAITQVVQICEQMKTVETESVEAPHG